MAYIDDGNLCIPYADVLICLRRFRELGAPVGAVLNTDKTNILTSTTGISPLPFLSADDQALLSQAIAEFTPAEEVRGLPILGVPIGGDEFIRNYLRDFYETMRDDTTALTNQMHDLQTIVQIYKKCILQRVPFQLTANVLLN